MTKTLLMAWRSLLRDWRAGELRLICLAIVISVASLTTVNFFTDRVRKATERQATELLAADLVVRSSRPIADSLLLRAQNMDLITTRTTSFRSIVVVGDTLQMSEVKAVESGYPIRGTMRVSKQLFGEEQATQDIPAAGRAWADPRLLQILGISIGDKLNLGESTLIVDQILRYEPDRGGDIFNIAPRLLINQADVAATGLILPGSRVRYHLLLGGDNESVSKFRRSIGNDRELRVQGIRDARPELKSALERAEQFLGLAALVSIALTGLAVAMSAQRYARRHFDNCAIMRCLGARQNTILAHYAWQMLILALAGSALGVLVGFLAQHVLASLMQGLTSSSLPAPSLLPVALGMIAGTVTTLGFAMPQLYNLRHVTPLRVLRRDLEPLPVTGITVYGLAVLSLALLTPWQSGDVDLTFYTFAGLLFTAAALVLVARLIIRFVAPLRQRVGVAWRYGLSNLSRRASLSVAQILGIGLGITIMLLLTLVRTDHAGKLA